MYNMDKPQYEANVKAWKLRHASKTLGEMRALHKLE